MREKAHTREGDAIAAARRRMPMTEVDCTSLVTGPDGPVPFVELFGEHDQLLVYTHLWHDGQPIEGSTLSIWHVHDASYLHARSVADAVVCEGPWDEVAPFVEFLGYTVPWYSGRDAADPAVGAGLLDTRGIPARGRPGLPHRRAGRPRRGGEHDQPGAARRPERLVAPRRPARRQWTRPGARWVGRDNEGTCH